MRCFGLKSRLVVALAAAVAFAACGGEEEPAQQLECGDNTELRDGVCVLQDHDCEDGEVVSPAGDCVDPGDYCDEDAQYDAETGDCVTDSDVVCGEGTTEQDGVCVVADPLECGEDTVLVDGLCQPDEQVCGPGTEMEEWKCELTTDACADGAQFDLNTEECVFEGVECGDDTIEHQNECIPLHSYADNLAQDADITYGDGEPIVASEDDSFVFAGALDNELSQTFELDGQEGQWLQITVYSRGLPSPGFDLVGPMGWKRAATPAMVNPPTRTVAIPEDDTYELTVNTSVTDRDSTEELADESWKYVGEVELIDAPEPTEWNFDEDSLSGDFGETTDNFVTADVSEATELYISARSIGEDVEAPTLERWDSAHQFDDRDQIELGERVELDVSDDNDIFLHVDAAELTGVDTQFEIAGQGTEDLPSNAFFYDQISAQAGDTILISHRSDQADPVGVRVFLDGDQFMGQFEDVLAENDFFFSNDETRAHYFYAPEDGDYLVEFQNTNDHELTSFVSTSTVDQFPLIEVDEQGVSEFELDLGGTNLEQGDWKVFHIDTPMPVLLSGAVSHDGLSFAPDVRIYDTDANEVASSTSFGSETPFDFTLDSAGTYLFAVQPTSSWTTINDIEVDLEAQAVEFVDADEIYETTFDAEAFDILTGSLDVFEGPSPTLRLINPYGVVVFEQTDADGLDLTEIIPGPGEFTLEVENTSDEPILGVDLQFDVTSPFDILDVDGDFSSTYSLDGLDEGEKDVLLVRPQTDYQLDFSAIFDDDEEGTVRLWNVDERNLVVEQTAEQRVDLEDVGVDEGTYIIEFEALTDVDDYSASFSGWDIAFVEEVREHDPDLEISSGGGYESSALAVDDCQQIADVSLTLDFSETPWSSSNINIYLYPPAFDQPITVRESSFGSHSTTYPDISTPDESFDPMIDTIGTGVWSIDIENNDSSSITKLDEWSLELTCMN